MLETHNKEFNPAGKAIPVVGQKRGVVEVANTEDEGDIGTIPQTEADTYDSLKTRFNEELVTVACGTLKIMTSGIHCS